MKKILLSAVTVFALTTTVNADFIGAEAGYAIWNSSVTGNIKKGTGTLDFEQDLGYGKNEVNAFMWAYIDHPLPFLPNLKIQKTKFSDSDSGTISTNITFGGQNFATSDSVTSTITLNQLDMIPYWRILDNWINLELGFNFKLIDGNMQIDTAGKHANEDFSLLLPMLYAKVRADLPFSGLSVEADMSYVGYNGNKFSDIKAGIVYETTYGVGATLGYRQQNITLNDIDDVYGELNIKGPYIGLFYHF